ncbi:hypothetical protein [Hyphomicrobium denitrificans]|uniref:hypothetical protein n=1 Tax=Hyphomicrobium denitrificans TaxID=53399 RepID=UPI0011817A34|nr:hypothetical protein [Hyphomicrobium denitrificans]
MLDQIFESKAPAPRICAADLKLEMFFQTWLALPKECLSAACDQRVSSGCGVDPRQFLAKSSPGLFD